MDYIDLEVEHPKENGDYQVKINGGKEGVRISRATWSPERGFELLIDSLGPEEYIFAWQIK